MPAIVFGGNDNYLAEAFQTGEEIDFQNIWKEKYGVSLIMEQTSEAEVIDLASELPTDTHIVTAKSLTGDLVVEAVRAYKKSDVFDAYFDAGYEVQSIKNGYGAIKPRLWEDSKKETNK